jgi:hypothetical protein
MAIFIQIGLSIIPILKCFSLNNIMPGTTLCGLASYPKQNKSYFIINQSPKLESMMGELVYNGRFVPP